MYTSRFHDDNSNPKFDHKDALKTCFSKEVNRYFDKKAKNIELMGHKVFLTDFAYLFPIEVQYYISYEYKHHLHWFWCTVPRFDLPGLMRMITHQYKLKDD